jgi:drug/metabolite transporter (DMT)-like permease
MQYDGMTGKRRRIFMFSYIWPIALVVVSNTLYQICANSVPEDMNPFASIIVTYLVGAAVSAILYFVLGSGGNLVREFGKVNMAPFVLGLAIVGLEAGWIYAYKAGWQVSTGFIVQSSFLAIVLLLVGYLLYHEALTWNKLLGAAICLIGLIFINYK